MNTALNGRKLKPHDGVQEIFVCKDCGHEADLAGSYYEGYTQEQADKAECPKCGSLDTGWLYEEEKV